MTVRRANVDVASPWDRWGAELTTLRLEQVRRRSEAAHRLADEPEGASSHDLEGLLNQVEEALAAIAGDDRLGPAVTATLRGLRDQLTSHLVAAASLEAIALPRAAVVDVLRRAAEATEKGLESVRL